MANTVRLGPRRTPIAEPVAAPACCLASGRTSGPTQASHRASSLRPPACALMTAGSTRWAWLEIDLRLSPVASARRVTASQPTVKTVAAVPHALAGPAVALDLVAASLDVGVRLPAPAVARGRSMLRRVPGSGLAHVPTPSAATRGAPGPSRCATPLSGAPEAPRPRTIACTR